MDKGAAYTLDNGDVYYRVSTQINPPFGTVSHDDRETMAALSAARGGDPETPGKDNPIDPLLWRAEREGEPSWDGGALGRGRPGWHVECTVIADKYLGFPVDVQGGGNDLIFPHHEMSAAHAAAWRDTPMAKTYMHTGMVGLDGEKMSKSKGNLVLVSKLRERGVDPMAIRTVILSNHYRSDWSFTEEQLSIAEARLQAWKHAAKCESECRQGLREHIIGLLREALTDDLDSPRALGILDEWANTTRTPSLRRPQRSAAIASLTPSMPCWASACWTDDRRSPTDHRVPVVQPSARDSLIAAAFAQIALELGRDGVSAGLRQLGRIVLLLQRCDEFGQPGIEGDELVGAEFPSPTLFFKHVDVDFDADIAFDSLRQCELGLRRRRLGQIVRHAHPQVDRSDSAPPARDAEEPENADGSLIAVGVDAELGRELGVLRIGHHRQRTCMRNLGMETAEEDDSIVVTDVSEDEGEELPPFQTRFVALDDRDRPFAEAAPMHRDTRPGDRGSSSSSRMISGSEKRNS